MTEILAATIGKPMPTQPLLLSPPTYCNECGAKKFSFESLHFCCDNGDISIVANEYPPELVRLFTAKDEDAVNFRKYARLYNNLFAFSSIGGKTDRETYKGIYVFKLHGQIYHSVPDLLPDENGPKYLQLYFYDGQIELEHRINCFSELRQDVIDILMRVTENNPYARFFRSLKEVNVNETTNIIINSNTVPDQRVYNAPISVEVAVIWPDSVSSSHSSWPHILVTAKSAKSHRIAHYYGCYDPLQYPLLFPKGECGWNQGLKKISHGGDRQIASELDPIQSCAVHITEDFLDAEETRKYLQLSDVSARRRKTKADRYISAREYYAYKLQIRVGNMLLRASRAFLQYITDKYIKVENTRLDFFRQNQDTIRDDLYKGILDTVQSGETSAANVGHKFILPPSFIGGPHDMKRRYLNTMALVQKYGKPDLFVTMTCKANWAEIKAELELGETAQDRPDLVLEFSEQS
ncbi:uncharacterized protein LOC110726143 [Chenopodium quinoa]|uniref:uncharacterized protein LOC110726143 n=1 Tax=Chenopodium quinoa TaxID=63459 RepID=UPI000B79AEFB|nr:uncharacterized protein LOC110726143 [Chenopodium quinoa]